MPQPLGNFTWVHQSWGRLSLTPAAASEPGFCFCCVHAAHRCEQALPSAPPLSQGGGMSYAQGKSVYVLYGQSGNWVSHESKCPGLTWSCGVGVRRRGDQAEDRELPVVPVTEDIMLHRACAPRGQCRVWERATRLQNCPRLAERSSWSSQSISCTSYISNLGVGIKKKKKVWKIQPPAHTNWGKLKLFCIRNILISHLGLCGNSPEMLWKPSLTHFVCWSRASSLRKNKANLASIHFLFCPLTFHFPKIKEKNWRPKQPRVSEHFAAESNKMKQPLKLLHFQKESSSRHTDGVHQALISILVYF